MKIKVSIVLFLIVLIVSCNQDIYIYKSNDIENIIKQDNICYKEDLNGAMSIEFLHVGEMATIESMRENENYCCYIILNDINDMASIETKLNEDGINDYFKDCNVLFYSNNTELYKEYMDKLLKIKGGN